MQQKPELDPSHLSNFMQVNQIPGEILHLEVPTPTVEAAAAAVGTEPDNIVKSLLFYVGEGYILAITCGAEHIERRALAVHFMVGRKKVKLADPLTVLEETGFQVGAMPPFGHLSPLPTIIDRRVLEKQVVYAGGGSEHTLLRIKPETILSVTNAQVLDLLIPPNQDGNTRADS
ncbi:MAG: YbaK/EbsC family protein [Chloroflexota bacterium]|nr:MAG: YbaK/EbsC family protein [Chloroflexota bacterium]